MGGKGLLNEVSPLLKGDIRRRQTFSSLDLIIIIIIIIIYLFIFGCVGSSFLCEGFL